jgi:hypothetical protein
MSTVTRPHSWIGPVVVQKSDRGRAGSGVVPVQLEVVDAWPRRVGELGQTPSASME